MLGRIADRSHTNLRTAEPPELAMSAYRNRTSRGVLDHGAGTIAGAHDAGIVHRQLNGPAPCWFRAGDGGVRSRRPTSAP
jgi:hypothetical protein